MNRALFVVAMVLLLVACETGEPTPTSSPFLGGTKGVDIKFVQGAPPQEVFDGGDFPFDVVVELRNIGEFFMPREDVSVELRGIQPQEFSLRQPAKSPSEDLLPRRLDAEGNIIEENPVFVEFTNLNHVASVVGASQTFPLRANVCYKYGTIANAQLCARENILNPREGGVCRIAEDKTVFNSGSPLQVASLSETARAQDKVGFTFKILHTGTGSVFRQDTRCDEVDRQHENRVYVRVETGLPGLQCSGLSEGSDGFVQLFGGEKTITCTQTISSRADFEFPVVIELLFDYQEHLDTNIVVKRSEI